MQKEFLEQLIQKVIGIQHYCNAVKKAHREILFAVGNIKDACDKCQQTRGEIEKIYKDIIDSM